MKSRRSFIANTGMATAALLAARPMKAIAGFTNSSSIFSNNHLVILHAPMGENPMKPRTYNFIEKIRKGAGSNIVLSTGSTTESTSNFSDKEEKGYEIVQKGAIKTGIIHIFPEDADVAIKMNTIARMLKQEMLCNLVVCVSRLGHNKKSGMDNLKLAALSEHVDLIIGNNTGIPSQKTFVLGNKLKQEVILQYPGNGDELACGKIEFSYDEDGTKRHIHLGSRLYHERIA
jgi:hypothetical protein